MGTLAKSEMKELSLLERLKALRNQPALLIDISGSTNRDIEPGCSELKAMQNIVENIDINTVYIFSDSCNSLGKQEFLGMKKGSGGTLIGKALKHLKSLGKRKIIIITDGDDENKDKKLALLEANDLQLKIMFVGPGARPKFLDELAAASSLGGFCTTEDLKQQKSLTEKLTLLLNPGKNERNIQL